MNSKSVHKKPKTDKPERNYTVKKILSRIKNCFMYNTYPCDYNNICSFQQKTSAPEIQYL